MIRKSYGGMEKFKTSLRNPKKSARIRITVWAYEKTSELLEKWQGNQSVYLFLVKSSWRMVAIFMHWKDKNIID